MFGCALPCRPGAAPVTNAFCAWLTSTARVEARSDTSIRWPGRAPSGEPGPDSPRSSNAASTAIVPNSPLTTSLIATPTLVGSPPSRSGAPVIDMSPPVA